MPKAIFIVVLFCSIVVPTQLSADLLVGQWYEFSFAAAGTAAHGCFPADMDPAALNCIPSAADNTTFAPAPSLNFTLQSPAYLVVTDAFLHGDSFDVFDGGELIFSTPPVAPDSNGCGDNPVICLTDPRASHASFLLGAGAQFITITPNQIGDAGAAYFMVTPEPSEWPAVLLGCGLAACAMARRKRLMHLSNGIR